jgi:hypothetical protein
MRIAETRQLRLSLDGLLEALLALDRQKNGWVWRGRDHAISVGGAADGSVVVEARRDSSATPQRMSYDRAFVAAALIHFCFLMRVPLPRTAQKEIEVTEEGAVLSITQIIEGPTLHLAVPAAPAVAPAPPRKGAAGG